MRRFGAVRISYDLSVGFLMAEGECMITDKRDLQKEFDELGIISIEGSGLLTEKAVFTALDAIRDSNAKRDEAKEREHIKMLQKKKLERMQAVVNG
jgi:hypothetical protein